MKNEYLRVEPLTTYIEKWNAPSTLVTRYGDTVYIGACPPFDPKTGEIMKGSIEEQAEISLQQLKLCLETAGSDTEHVLKLNIYCTSAEKFAAVNEIYRRYFTKNLPARIYIIVPKWTADFDIEMDCIATVKDENK